ncbi:MAG: iron-sulfur cluster assembly scaffold protein [Candidatus Omnitrophota bacterium]|nr:iron-sulfur cluster assembly scaffold protein [Candidatus Omnitrophota bacterium]
MPITAIKKKPYEGRIYNLEVPNAHSFITNSLCLHNCGDVMWIYIKVKDNVIVDSKFETFGCVAAIATSSILTDLVKGKTIEEALKVSNKDVVRELGGLPSVKMHCSLLAEEGIKAAIEDYRKKSKDTNPSKD